MKKQKFKEHSRKILFLALSKYNFKKMKNKTILKFNKTTTL